MIRPILFNSDMVRAILEGRKTVTRRVIKDADESMYAGLCGLGPGLFDRKTGLRTKEPYYRLGDILYVRETFCPNYFDVSIAVGLKCSSRHAFKADYRKEAIGDIVPEPKWRPSIHMPKEAARIWLRVVDVRAERLQEISNEQIIKEGARQEKINNYIAQMPEKTEVWTNAAYALEWMQIWDSTVKKKDLDTYGWTANPWVWVIEFERCEKPEE
ncbi:hypothetical protein [Enterocloster asparagiformis]|uniref:hypothetical protein n=1 Tax=Enterocloster asparagiformis TaxID=333367 RepID=UPI0004668040|nr:hypothetical protein [Enterocloster asparagiformis]